MSGRSAVGLLGLGLLGEALARRLLDAGFEVSGFDLDPAKNAGLAELGGRPAVSVAAVAESCHPIVLAVFITEQVETILELQLLPVVGDNSVLIVLFASAGAPDRVALPGSRAAPRVLRL